MEDVDKSLQRLAESGDFKDILVVVGELGRLRAINQILLTAKRQGSGEPTTTRTRSSNGAHPELATELSQDPTAVIGTKEAGRRYLGVANSVTLRRKEEKVAGWPKSRLDGHRRVYKQADVRAYLISTQKPSLAPMPIIEGKPIPQHLLK